MGKIVFYIEHGQDGFRTFWRGAKNGTGRPFTVLADAYTYFHGWRDAMTALGYETRAEEKIAGW